jgi:hypothetical protein
MADTDLRPPQTSGLDDQANGEDSVKCLDQWWVIDGARNGKTGRFQKGHAGGRIKGSTNKISVAAAKANAESGESPVEYLTNVYRDPEADRNQRISAAAALCPYLVPRLKPVRRVSDPVVIAPPQNASEAASAMAFVAARAAAGQMDLTDASDVVKLLESYVRAFAASDLEMIVAKVREEVRAELLSVGIERHAEYCVPEAPTAQ